MQLHEGEVHVPIMFVIASMFLQIRVLISSFGGHGFTATV